MDFEVETFVAEPAHTLRAEGFDASEDGTGRGTPLVPICIHTDAIGRTGTALTPSVDALGNVRLRDAGMGFQEDVSYNLTTGLPHAVAFPERLSGTQFAGAEDRSPSLCAQNPMAVAIQAGALRENPNSGPDGAGVQSDLAYTIEARAEVQAVAFDLRGREGGAQFEGPHDTANIRAASGGSSRSYVAESWAVRRLSVTECERLQGYPDGHTLIEVNKRRTVVEDEARYLLAKGAHVALDNQGRWRTNAAADGPRYKALGNAWAVACVRPIALGIMRGLAA